MNISMLAKKQPDVNGNLRNVCVFPLTLKSAIF